MFVEYDAENHAYFCNEAELTNRRIVMQWPERVASLCPFLWGHVAVYCTAEHAYQAARALDLESAKLMEIDGPFSDVRVLAKWPNADSKQLTDVRQEVLAQIKGCLVMGRVAQMAATVDATTAMDLWGLRLGRPLSPEHRINIWTYILKQKFLLGTSQAQLLLATQPAQLVCHNPKATLLSLQSGRVDPITQQVIGMNTAGKCLMAVRADLERATLMCKFWDSPAWIVSPPKAEREEAEALFNVLLLYTE